MLDTTATTGAARLSTREMATAALLAGLLMAVAFLPAISLGVVPVTLQVFVVLLACLLLRPGAAAAALGVYLLAGAAGAPVFSNATGGLGVIVGPTGGYLFGFFAGAVAGSFVRSRLRGTVGDVLGLLACVVVVYLAGWAQLAAVTQMGAHKAFVAGVLPFVGFDVVKAVVAFAVAATLRRAGFGR